MSRARLLKPGFFTNEELHTLHPYARLLFAGLWTIADREGRLEDRPLRIKGELFPYDNVKTDHLLDDLAKAGFILRYESGGGRYIQIVNFLKHQSPHVREPASTIPAPEGHKASTGPAPGQHKSGPAVAVAVIDPVPDPDPDPVTGNPVPGAAAACLDDTAYRRITDAWMGNTGSTLSQTQAERLEAYAERLSLPWVLDAIGEAGANGVKRPNYVYSILDRWALEGRERTKNGAPPGMAILDGKPVPVGPDGRPEARGISDTGLDFGQAPEGYGDE